MLFNSLVFLYAFLPVTYFVFWRLKTKQQRYIWLAVTGYVFYGYWDYRFCFLMLFSTLVSYTAGLYLLKLTSPRSRKLALTIPIVIDLSLLGFFKYISFFLDTLGSLSSLFAVRLNLPHYNILLPIGISFYTFHTISYIVDSYRGVTKPTKNFFEFACYVSLFSQLVAGPIVRFREIEGDLEKIGEFSGSQYLSKGWSFFTIGLAKKVLIADSIATIINPGFLSHGVLSSYDTWLCALGYTYQLYFDFSGYSDMAVGLGYLFNIHIPQNFNSPYKSKDFSDFWRRWHMSLSGCLRDYVYIPLGGSRFGVLMTYRNLILTMLIGGLWHGANWTFVVWGGYHGLLLAVNRAFSDFIEKIPMGLKSFVVFILVVIGWVWFRSDTLGAAHAMLNKMFFWQSGEALIGQKTLVLLIAVAAGISHFGRNTFELLHNWSRPAIVAFSLLFLLCILVISSGKPSPFLYFQF